MNCISDELFLLCQITTFLCRNGIMIICKVLIYRVVLQFLDSYFYNLYNNFLLQPL